MGDSREVGREGETAASIDWMHLKQVKNLHENVKMQYFCINISNIFEEGAIFPFPDPTPYPSAPIQNFWIRH